MIKITDFIKSIYAVFASIVGSLMFNFGYWPSSKN